MKELNINSLHKFPAKPALWTLFLLLIGGFFITIFLSSIIAVAFKANELSVMRWSVVLQNVFTFIMPALLMALIVFRRPLGFLSVTKRPSLFAVIGIIVIYIAATPALNFAVAMNEAMSLPSWMQPVEDWMKASEATAKAMTDKLISAESLPQLLLAVLLVGVLTGIGEEFFFRGAMQNIFSKCIRNKHVAVWSAAFIFSAFHLQFYGFVPRMLLGAILGYSLLWSGSLWVPIICHALNNSMVVVFSYLTKQGIVQTDISNAGAEFDGFPTLAAISLVATVLLMVAYYIVLTKNKLHDDHRCY